MTDGGGPCVRRFRGDPFMEVFSVRYNGVDAAKIHGTIKITNDALNFKLLYSREREKYESVEPGEILTLIDPSKVVSFDDPAPRDISLEVQPTDAYDSVAIDVELWFSPENDEESVYDRMVWRAYDHVDKLYNYPRSYTYGGGGERTFTMDYAVFTEAGVAMVDVRLISADLPPKEDKKKILNEADGKDSAHLYGWVTAQENSLKKEIRLFRVVEPTESLKVRPGELIPLSRSLVVVPLESSLTVGAKLYGYDPESGSESVDHLIVADDSMNFRPEIPIGYKRSSFCGTSTKQRQQRQKITSEYGEIEVTVTWIYM